MRNLINITFFLVPFYISSQALYSLDNTIGTDDSMKILKWYLDINEKGIDKKGDSIIFSKEFVKVLNDEEYRLFIFPETYKKEVAAYLIDKKLLKQAFWYFINLYPQSDLNKETILKAILSYDQVLKMDEVLVNTFYTYSFMDPEISIIKDGKPEIVHPDILEKKLSDVKEMVGYILKYRKKKN